MKMKGQLDSAQPMKPLKKKQKQKAKKAELKKKKQDQLAVKKVIKEKPSTPAKKAVTPAKKTLIPPQPIIALVDTPMTTSQPQATPQPDQPRLRVSKHVQALTAGEQTTAINRVIKRLIMGEITQGMALRELRVRVLGLKQDSYSNSVGVSRKTLSEIENDKGNYTSEIINKVFKPFELKVGLVPTSSQILSAILIN